MRIKKKLSLLAIYCLIAFSLTSFISEAKASNVTRNIPLYYFDINNEARTINLTIQMSTATIQKGTIITVAGIPNDALGWADYGKQYAVEFEEKVDENTDNTANHLLYGVWGGLFWHTGQSYKNGIVTYTVAGTHPVDIYLGAWADDLEGGFDERYTIQIDGSISGTGLGNTEYEYYITNTFIIGSKISPIWVIT